MVSFRPSRQRQQGHDRFLWPAVALFFVVAVLGLVGMAMESNLLVIVAILLMGTILFFRVAARRRRRRADPEE